MLSPVELEIELFCRGMRIDESCDLDEDGRRVSRTRAGLGSGLEIILPAPRKSIWVNVPVVERFASSSPLRLVKQGEQYRVFDERTAATYPVEIPEEPSWYSRRTSSGVEMSRVGVLQGNYLGIYVSNACLFWASKPARACKFCTTGKNVGVAEQARKSVEDVVEVALAARDESGSVFTHLNTGHILPAIGVGVCGLTSHYCLSNAFRAGDASLVVPLDFMRIPLIAVVGWAFYGESLDIFVLIGALIIVAGVVWNLRSESTRIRLDRDLAPP